METWHLWTAFLAGAISYLSVYFDVSEAVAIMVLTGLARVALMPISIAASLRMERNKEKLRCVKPALDALKERFKGKQAELAAATMQLHKQNGIRFFDRLTLVNMATQSFFGLGIYQAITRTAFKSRFLWIGSLAKPDALLTFLVALVMVLAMSMAPGAFGEPTFVIVLCVSVLVTVFAVAAMPSAVGIYWATSNVASFAQSCLLRWLRLRDGVATTGS